MTVWLCDKGLGGLGFALCDDRAERAMLNIRSSVV